MTPDRRQVANALLAAQCPAGVCARDVTELDRALRDRLMLQAANLIGNPYDLLAALGLDEAAATGVLSPGTEHGYDESAGGARECPPAWPINLRIQGRTT